MLYNLAHEGKVVSVDEKEIGVLFTMIRHFVLHKQQNTLLNERRC